LRNKPYVSLLSKQDSKAGFESLPDELFNIKDVKINFQEAKSGLSVKTKTETRSASSAQEKVWITKKGNKVIFIPETTGSVVSAKIAFEGGELLTEENQQGLVSLFGNLWTREFESFSEQEVAEKMDFFCSGFSAFSGKHSVGLSLTSLTKYFDDLSVFFKYALTEPVFSQALIDREKESLINQLKSRVDRPSAVAFKEFSKLMFKDHFYSRDSIGVVEHIEALKKDDLKVYFEKTKQQKCVFTIVGDLSLDQIEKLVSEVELV